VGGCAGAQVSSGWAGHCASAAVLQGAFRGNDPAAHSVPNDEHCRAFRGAQMNERATAEQGQYLGLFIGEDEYAIGILQVREILQFESITRVPGMPASVRGVINVRGSVVPVVDLAVKFGLPETAITSRTCIVILEAQVDGAGTVMGVMADSVSQVIDLGLEEIQPPPSFGTRVHVDYLLGMGISGKKFIMILDIDRILTLDELLEVTKLQGASPEAAPAEGETPAPSETVAEEAHPQSRPRTEPSAGRAVLDEEALEGLVRARPGRGGGTGAGRKEK
jgi:purine-binding chemotaxis protein CheW